MNLLFNGGCVWGFFEFIGAYHYIKKHNISYEKLYGVSSGAAIALCLLLDVDIPELTGFAEQTVRETKFKPLNEIQLAGIKFVLDKRPNAYKIANKRLYIGLTNRDGFYFKSKFRSNEELANTVICGATIPIFSSYNSICDNKPTIDGGIGFMKHHIPKNTIVIRPTTPFPYSIIPPPEIIQTVLGLIGYLKTEHYIKTNNAHISYRWYSAPELLPLWLYLHDIKVNARTFPNKNKICM
jgi:hypothetical protein